MTDLAKVAEYLGGHLIDIETLLRIAERQLAEK